jgi:hypothetical protein
LEALFEIELGVVVNFALETATWLLRQIVVTVGERSIQQDPFYSLIDVE